MQIIVQIKGVYGGWFDEITCSDMAQAEREAADVVANGERPEDVRIIAGEIRMAPASSEWSAEDAHKPAYGREEYGDELYAARKEAA